MRIVKIHSYYTQPGGEDTVFQGESALLRDHGHQVFEYIEQNKKIEKMSKASVALQTVWSFSSYKKVKEFLKHITPDVVHFHNTFPLISPSAYYACRDLKIPVVQTLDNQRLICPASSFYRDGNLCLECFGKTPPWPGVIHACYHRSHIHTAVVASMIAFHHLLKTWQTKVDAFFCSTNFYRGLFVQAGFPAEKIIVMPHFVDDKVCSETIGSRGDYALFVGRLDPEKGVRTLLEAWRNLDFPLKIRGGGKLYEETREYVKQNKMDKIEFVGRLNENELSNLVANARFLVAPSEGYYETFGLVIIEAYARGVPVVASNIGVTPELVSDNFTGKLFEAGNSHDLAEKAKWMWNHPAETKAMGENGMRFYQERFSPEQCYKTLIETYERLINSR